MILLYLQACMLCIHLNVYHNIISNCTATAVMIHSYVKDAISITAYILVNPGGKGSLSML